MADILDRKIKLGDFVVFRKYGGLKPARVVRVTKKRVALAYSSSGYDYRTNRRTYNDTVICDRAPRVPHDQCAILERGEPEIVARLEEWNTIVARLRPPLPLFLGRSEEDIAYWTRNHVCGSLEE